MASTLAWGESLEVLLDIGAPVFQFTLDDPVLGLLNGDGILDGTTTIDVSQWAQNVSINRGRSDELAQFQTGSCAIQLWNQDRRFDPINTSSPYYSATLGATSLTPKRKVQIKSKGISIFTGKIQDIDIGYDFNNSFVTITASDNFVELASAVVQSAFTPPIESSGTRVTRILDLPEVVSSITRSIDTGTQSLGAFPVDIGTTALGYIQACAEAESGNFFIEGDGTLRFTQRIAAAFPEGIVATFSDTGTDIPYTNLGITYGSELTYNKIIVSINGGTPQISNDATSQSAYGIITLDMTDTLLETDAQAASLASTLLEKYKNPQYRFDDISAMYNGLSAGNQTTLSNLELADFVSITRNFPSGAPTSVTQIVKVEQIRHSITPTGHRIDLKFAQAQLVYRFTLDNATLSRLDALNALS
jgi:hypothetical protein